VYCALPPARSFQASVLPLILRNVNLWRGFRRANHWCQRVMWIRLSLQWKRICTILRVKKSP